MQGAKPQAAKDTEACLFRATVSSARIHLGIRSVLMKIGFSTGSVALADVRRGVSIAKSGKTNAIELSALREVELEPLLELLDQLDLQCFEYISFHAPSKREFLSETYLVAKLNQVA